MGIPLPARGVWISNPGRSFDRRDVWVGSKPTERLQASPGRNAKASKETNEDHSSEWREYCARKTKKGDKKFQKSARKDLTEPTLLSRWEKRGRGGTEDETVKPLDGIQRVQIPPGQSERAGR